MVVNSDFTVTSHLFTNTSYSICDAHKAAYETIVANQAPQFAYGMLNTSSCWIYKQNVQHKPIAIDYLFSAFLHPMLHCVHSCSRNLLSMTAKMLNVKALLHFAVLFVQIWWLLSSVR